MTALSTSEFNPRTYRRASSASYVVGIAALLLGIAVGEALIGTVVYVAAFVVGVTIPRASPQSVYDERDEALAARTSDLVLTAIGFGGFAAFVSLWTLELLGRFTWSSELLYVFWAWCAFWLLWGGTYTYVRFRA